MFNKILVAIDGSPASEKSARRGRRSGRALSGRAYAPSEWRRCRRSSA